MKGLVSDKGMLEYELMKSYPNIFCFSTARQGGCSVGNYASFNCTHYCGDNPEHVRENRDRLLTLLPVRPEALVIPRQTHSLNVGVIASLPADEDLQGVDALVSNLPGYCLCVSTADCVPVLLYDREHRAIAAVHAGWRGTVGRIVERTLDAMKREFGTDGKEVVASIGPSISVDSFEVGDEVYAAFEEAGFAMPLIALKQGKWHIDLWEANRLQLLDKGVQAENIEVSGICTYKEHEHFFSARRLGISSGRMLSGIMLLEK